LIKRFKILLEFMSWQGRKKTFGLMAMITVMALLDTIGVAAIMPFISVLVNPELVETNGVLRAGFLWFNKFGINTVQQYFFVLGVLVFALLMASILFRALTTYVQIRFGQFLEYTIGKRLLRNYLGQPYVWFLNRHGADLGKTVISEVHVIIVHGVMPLITILAQGAVAIGILSLLILADFALALTIGAVLALTYGVTYFIVGGLLTNIGNARFQANEQKFRILTEAFNAVKEVKIFNLETIYVQRFDHHANALATHQGLAEIIGLMPRFVLEIMIFGGMMTVVLYLMMQKGSFISALPTVSLYAFAGYRLMPALQQIYSSFSQLRYSAPSIDAVDADLRQSKPSQPRTIRMQSEQVISFNKELVLDDVHFCYPEARKPSVKGVDLKIPFKSSVGFVGPTGSGKTTLVDIIIGLLCPQQGVLKIDGQVVDEGNIVAWQRSIGYVPQHIYLTDTTVASNIAFGVDENDIDYHAVERAARVASLHEFVISEMPEKYQTVIGERGVRLSGGQRQRIGIARALYHNPDVLILDEATSALDNATEHAVMDAVHNLRHEITTIQISHRLSTVSACDIIFLMNNGKLAAQGSFEDLAKNHTNFSDMGAFK